MIFDLLSSPAPLDEQPAATAVAAAAGVAAAGPPATPTLPWHLTVHYRNAPPSAASSWQNPGSVQQLYFSSLKVHVRPCMPVMLARVLPEAARVHTCRLQLLTRRLRLLFLYRKPATAAAARMAAAP